MQLIAFPPKSPLKVKFTLNTGGKRIIKCSDCWQVKALRQVTDARRSYVGAKGWLNPLSYQGILTSKNDFGYMNRVLLFRPHILGGKDKFIYINKEPSNNRHRGCHPQPAAVRLSLGLDLPLLYSEAALCLPQTH